jgi:hypothetical protein
LINAVIFAVNAVLLTIFMIAMLFGTVMLTVALG